MTGKKALTMVTARWQEVFLTALRETGHVGRSCEVAKIGKNTAYMHRRANPDFAKAWETAIEDAAYTLEDEAVRRARDGYDEPIIYKGKIIGTQKRYSDVLLMFLLKGIKPDKWADKLTIHITAEDLETLKRMGFGTASDAWQALMENARAENATDTGS